MRPVRAFGFDARLLFLFAPWLFFPGWWTTATLLLAIVALRIAEARGYRLGTALRVQLPEIYRDGDEPSVAGEVVEVPFRASVNPNSREVARARGSDAVD